MFFVEKSKGREAFVRRVADVQQAVVTIGGRVDLILQPRETKSVVETTDLPAAVGFVAQPPVSTRLVDRPRTFGNRVSVKGVEIPVVVAKLEGKIERLA